MKSPFLSINKIKKIIQVFSDKNLNSFKVFEKSINKKALHRAFLFVLRLNYFSLSSLPKSCSIFCFAMLLPTFGLLGILLKNLSSSKVAGVLGAIA